MTTKHILPAEDFMFEINKAELENLRLQIGTSSWGGIRYIPFAFTGQGIPPRGGGQGEGT